MLLNIDFYLSLKEIFYSAILAFFVSIFISIIYKYKKISNEIVYPKDTFYQYIKKFYEIFPKDSMDFKGQVLTKGMKIRLTTLKRSVYEGEIVGFNNKKSICIITTSAIVTNKFKNIDEIVKI